MFKKLHSLIFKRCKNGFFASLIFVGFMDFAILVAASGLVMIKHV